jgi:hypothetical protein
MSEGVGLEATTGGLEPNPHSNAGEDVEQWLSVGVVHEHPAGHDQRNGESRRDLTSGPHSSFVLGDHVTLHREVESIAEELAFAREQKGIGRADVEGEQTGVMARDVVEGEIEATFTGAKLRHREEAREATVGDTIGGVEEETGRR